VARTLTDEQKQVVAAIRQFVEKEVRPAASALEHSDSFPDALVAGMKDLGLFGSLIPEELGGLGLTWATYALIIEEISRGWASLALLLEHHVTAALIVAGHGTDEQKRRFLSSFAAGDSIAGLCLFEPNAGEDLEAIQTTARREGNRYVISGTKTFVTNGRGGACFILLARVGKAGDGMSCFIVEKGAPGFTVGRDLDKLGYRGLDTCEIHFEDFTVPKENLVGGKEGEGFKQVMAGLEVGRINIAARGVGVAQAAFESALDYLRERPATGRPIVRDPAILLKLAGMATTLEAARALTYWAAEKKDSGERCDLEAGMAKLFASEASYTVSLEAMSIHGGDGYTTGHVVERCYRDAPLLIIGEGTNEIQRLVIARQLLKAHPV
jgi:alkylation response protein AidB-like acyl-CoA dehydrogenase